MQRLGATGGRSAAPVAGPGDARRAVVLLSGGLDSATVAAMAAADGYTVIALSCRYGQRHHRELEAAAAVARALGVAKHYEVAVNLGNWGGSSLTDPNQAIPTAGVTTEGIPSTYVPFRNTVFIAMGLSLAEACGAERLALGVNAVDYSGYPDCRGDYLEQMQRVAQLGSRAGREGRATQLWAPLLNRTKADIVRCALDLGVPIASTWSCYGGGDQPCGRCDSCRIRDQALQQAGVPHLASAWARDQWCSSPAS